ncbi:MAG: ArsR/SmtB family transcription factor [Micromonosporaceae bacterium]
MPFVPEDMLEEIARRFALLGDTTRLRIVRILHERGEATVSEIAAATGTSAANASQHLRRLLLGGLAGRTRDGQAVRYRIIDPAIEQVCAIVCGSLSSGTAAMREAVGA